MPVDFDEIRQRLEAAERAAEDARTPRERGFAAGLIAEANTMLDDAIERLRVNIRDEQDRLREELETATPDYADIIRQEISQLDHLHFQAGERLKIQRSK